MSAFDPAVFWGAFAAAGMLKQARVAMSGCATEVVAMVGWFAPDTIFMDGAQSKQYLIEYQADDLPTLQPEDEMVIDGVLYRVRAPSFVAESDVENNSGFFRRAYLTAVP